MIEYDLNIFEVLSLEGITKYDIILNIIEHDSPIKYL